MTECELVPRSSNKCLLEDSNTCIFCRSMAMSLSVFAWVEMKVDNKSLCLLKSKIKPLSFSHEKTISNWSDKQHRARTGLHNDFI